MINRNRLRRHIGYSNRHFCSTLFLVFSATILLAQPPAISSFSPLSGSVGTTVTITGTNFNPISSQNVVYFGPVKAIVQSSATNQLTVTVPSGAASGPITVTNIASGLTTYSSRQFAVTFPGGDNFLSHSSFDNEVIVTIQNSPGVIAVGDLDGDGKPDVAANGDFGGSGYYISSLRNTSSPGHISFGPSADSSYSDFDGWALKLADINGDGLLDLISSSSQTISVFKNISTPGNIRFSAAITITAVAAFANSLEVGDMDNDGRPDLVFISVGRALTVIRNIGSLDTIAFASAQTILPPPTYAGDNLRLKVADFDNDGRADVAMVYTYVDSVVVAHNNSTPGNLAFDQVFKYNAGGDSRPYDLCVADMDGDGKIDIAYTNNEGSLITILKNISTQGNLDFNPYGGFGPLYFAGPIVDGDINGDGKPDLAFAGYNSGIGDLGMLLNNSVPCNSILSSFIDINENSFLQIVLSDMDGDGKPDLVTGLTVQNAIGVRRNLIGQQLRFCAGDTATIPSLIAGTNYQWQQSNGSGFANITDNAWFSGSNTASLEIQNIPPSLDNTTYRCIADGDTSNVFPFFVTTSATPAISIEDCPNAQCTGSPNTVVYASVLNSGSSPIYQWQDSTDALGWKNIRQGSNDSLHYQATVDNSRIRCLLRSNSHCATPDSALSNTIALRIFPSITPGNVIAGNTQVAMGESTTLTATPTNGGYWPQYQWQDSTGVAGWVNVAAGNSVNIVYTPAKSGDKIRCMLRSTDGCALPKIVYSNVLVFTVNVITALNPSPANNYHVHLFPNPSYTVLNIDSLKLSDNWQTLEIFALNGQRKTAVSLAGVTAKIVDVSSLPAGIYLAVLTKKDNQFAYYKFVKVGR